MSNTVLDVEANLVILLDVKANLVNLLDIKATLVFLALTSNPIVDVES